MLKSPEEYLSELSFSPPDSGDNTLTPGEKIFIEKYLGLEAFEQLPKIVPESVPLPKPVRTMPPQKSIVVVSKEEAEKNTAASLPVFLPEKEEPVAKAKTETLLKVADRQPDIAVAPSLPNLDKTQKDITTEPPGNQKIQQAKDNPQTKSATIITSNDNADKNIIRQEDNTAAETEIIQSRNTERKTGAQPAYTTPEQHKTAASATENAEKDNFILPPLKERLKDETEIQMVSFFISDQIFLLPVIAIQEVLRHQELIKIPKAPEFVAGVINLRGRVTPLVYLSALLTNNNQHLYSEKNFIIICGTQQLQIGLIIDRINSMHLVSQNKIIWNAEAKLGDSAEFLCAIANLDEKVCGIVAPETIAQKIHSS